MKIPLLMLVSYTALSLWVMHVHGAMAGLVVAAVLDALWGLNLKVSDLLAERDSK